MIKPRMSRKWSQLHSSAQLSSRVGSARTLRPTGTLERGDKERGDANFTQEKQEMWQFPSNSVRQSGWPWRGSCGIQGGGKKKKRAREKAVSGVEWRRNVLEARGVKELKDQSECAFQLPSPRSVRTERWLITALIPSWKYFSPSARVRLSLCISAYFSLFLSTKEFLGTVLSRYGKSKRWEFYSMTELRYFSIHSSFILWAEWNWY